MQRINRANNKKALVDAINSFRDIDSKSIGEVIELAEATGLLRVDDTLASYKDVCQYIYERVCVLPFKQFRNLYEYLEGRTPFSTQHKTKGTEFKHVFLLMDNGRWNQYNYGYLLSGTPSGKSEKPRERTNKLFYVCCTRAKEDLVMYYPNPSESDLMKAREWFGVENVVPI
jgi:DNA helicase-2/ATP-dependent DNA helicase PcrA